MKISRLFNFKLRLNKNILKEEDSKRNNLLVENTGLNNIICTRGSSFGKPSVIRVSGNNNKVYVLNSSISSYLSITVNGDDNVIVINNEYVSFSLSLTLGQLIHGARTAGCSIHMCHGSVEDAHVFNLHSNHNIIIKRGHMMSHGIKVWNTDSHPVYDVDSMRILNKPSSRNLIIEKNVWLGLNAVVLKNAHIPAGSIVGINAVVTKKFEEHNVLLAGSPARIVRKNVCWKSSDSDFI